MDVRKGCVGLSLVFGLVGGVLLGGSVRGAEEAERGEAVDYSGHAVVLVEAVTPVEFEAVNRLGINLACRFVPGRQALVIERNRLGALDMLGLAWEVDTLNVQEALDGRAAENRAALVQRDATFYTAYRTWTEISDLIDTLVATNPAIATRVLVGQSLENRDIFGIVIRGVNAPVDAPKVLFNGCQHAREWMSPMSVCYIAEQLVTGYGVDSQITGILDSVEVHLVPVVNPDGYLYTWSTSRFWRKNMRDNGDGTTGVDLNRNWSYQWGGPGSAGATNDELYRGPSPFSEPETTALSSYMASIAGGAPCTVGVDCGDGDECTSLKAHVDIHTYSAYVLGPWGWDDTITPPREAELRAAQEAMGAAMVSQHGFGYLVGLGVDQLLYIADGICPDWTFGVLGALSWTFELRPGPGQGLAGFDPPPADIILGCEEAYAGVLALLDRVSVVGLSVEVVEAPTALIIGEGGGLVRATAQASGDCALSVSGVTLWHREEGGGGFTPIAMADTGAAWEATIPDAACGSITEYYVEASGSGGESETIPPDAPATLLSAESIEVLLSRDDDFEVASGWTVGEPDDTASSGVWERVDPEQTSTNGEIAQPEDDFSADGTLCWVTAGTAGASAGTNDVDGGKTTLVSPVLDLSGTDNATVSFELWYSNHAGGAPNSDEFRVDVTNDGSAWSNAITVGPTGVETDGGWIHYEFQVESVVGLTSTVQVRFVAEDAGTGSLVEAAVDEFVVRESQACTPPPVGCVGDIDGDGDTDVFDFGVLAGNFGSAVPVGTGGDLDDDGDVDVFDFALFASDFGCVGLP